MFGYSFLNLEGHSMKSKFVIFSSNEEQQIGKDSPNEKMMQTFFKVQVTDYQQYLQQSLCRQVNIYLSYSNGRMNVKPKAKYRMQKFNLADVLFTMKDCHNEEYMMTHAINNDVWQDGGLYKISKVQGPEKVELTNRKTNEKTTTPIESEKCDVKNILD